MPDMKTEIGRRRTFAIISHPDAGKTTLTEKLLLYGGVFSGNIQYAGPYILGLAIFGKICPCYFAPICSYAC